MAGAGFLIELLMRYVWLVFAGLLAVMALVLPRLNRAPAASRRATWAPNAPAALPVRRVSSFAELGGAPPAGPAARADSVVVFGLAQRGSPYVYAGTSPLTGFDCSGFIMYTFAHFKVAVPHSTALLIDVGRPVDRAEAQPGDIVMFTGTAPTSAVPGHAGIVVSRRGEVPLRFVHASSARRESGVKVSQVEGTDYERRFMQVRRVLGPGALAAAPVAPAPARAARKAAAVAALPARPVAVEPVAVPIAALPNALVPRKRPGSLAKSTRHAGAKKPTITHKKPAATRKPLAKKPAMPKQPGAKKKPGPAVRHKAATHAPRPASRKHAAH